MNKRNRVTSGNLAEITKGKNYNIPFLKEILRIQNNPPFKAKQKLRGDISTKMMNAMIFQ